MSIDLRADAGNPGPLIPGAYERNTLTYRQPGSMGASGSLPMGSRSMDAATIADREREGGGAPSQRRRVVQGVAGTTVACPIAVAVTAAPPVTPVAQT